MQEYNFQMQVIILCNRKTFCVPWMLVFLHNTILSYFLVYDDPSSNATPTCAILISNITENRCAGLI